MLELTQRITLGGIATRELTYAGTLTLAFDLRQKSRFRTQLDPDEAGLRKEVYVHVERGQVLSSGDVLCSSSGELVKVQAKAEELSQVRCDDTLLLLRAAYHLGNRHVPLQIDVNGVAYQHDHVLDDMVRSLGLTVTFVHAPFNPESGAYGQGHAHHSHGHSHRGHTHSNDAEADAKHRFHAHDGDHHSHAHAHDGEHHSHDHAHGGDHSHSHGHAHDGDHHSHGNDASQARKRSS